jgi:hypothetical protein
MSGWSLGIEHFDFAQIWRANAQNDRIAKRLARRLSALWVNLQPDPKCRMAIAFCKGADKWLEG